jgi:L-aminopeptidase/D-esterase-like protein
MARPGLRNLITDVEGILVGNASDSGARTGVTVVFPVEPTLAGVDVRGGAPGTREISGLDPSCLIERVDAVVLSGGSAFGLDAPSGVASWLAARGRGLSVGRARVPIVPGAILFDLLNGGDKDWGEESPYRALGHLACEHAAADFALGNVGAGLGATAGPLKGGLGSASAVTGDGLQVGALVAANPMGSAVMPGCATLWAWALEQQGEFGGQPLPVLPLAGDHDYAFDAALGANTTIAVIATNAALDKAQATRAALMAHDGIARAISPAHTPYDGDTVFALATARRPLPDNAAAELARIGAIAADCLARAIGRAVVAADSLGDAPSYRARYGHALSGSVG